MFAYETRILPCLVLLGATFAIPAMKADEFEKKTTVTVNEPLQLPHTVLQPGKYVFRLMDNPDRHIVLIYTGDGTRFLTRELAIPNQRLTPKGKTQFLFWETPAGQPKALRAWFYPGDHFGQEFAYPKMKAAEIAKVAHEPVLSSTPKAESEYPTSPFIIVDEDGRELAKEFEKAPAMAANVPPVAPNPEPRAETPAASPVPERLPHTASPLPFIGLLGLGSLAISGLLSRRTKG